MDIKKEVYTIPKIRVGSCIGTLYQSSSCTGACRFANNRCFCVHNGRFKYALYGQTRVYELNTPLSKMPDAIVVSHWTLRGGVPHLETDKKLTRIVDVRLTPDLSPSNPYYCGSFRGQSSDPNNIILPGTCIGTYYNQTGTPDIKNGRYLYWVDNNGNRHCVINRKKRIPDIVVYYHYNIQQNSSTGFVSLKPEITYKYGVIDVFRTRLT